MATNYDPNTNASYNTTTTTTEKRRTWAWVIGAIVLLAIIVSFAMPNNDRSGTEPTAGTAPTTMESNIPAATTPAPAAPAAPN
ncbi:MAG: hypothetical protein AB7E79_15555 [Rhodospirillaceae bacterium]